MAGIIDKDHPTWGLLQDFGEFWYAPQGAVANLDNKEMFGMNGTNDDVAFMSYDTGSSTSSFMKVDLPAAQGSGGAIAEGVYEMAAFTISPDTYEMKGAVGVAQGGADKGHAFEGFGANQGRWMYGSISGDDWAAQLETFVILTGERENSGGALSQDKTYFYKASFTYDGYQESPLETEPHLVNTPNTSGDNDVYKITVKIKGISYFSKRISHLNIYVAEGDALDPGNTDAEEPTGFYRLLESIPLDTGWQRKIDSTGGTIFSSEYREKIIYDKGKSRGPSYEALNNISEVIQDTMVNYTVSAQLNNQLFVGNCYHGEINGGDAEQFLFKSKPYNFSQFDWTSDLLRLPSVPTAMASFNGRIYAFDKNSTYRIEPNSFYIEDVYEGVGCAGPDAVIVTEYGMCFADDSNIYLHDGRTPNPIGNPIIKSSHAWAGWQNRDKTWPPIVHFDSKRNSFLIFRRHSGAYLIYSFNISRKRWDDLTPNNSASEPAAPLIGRDGETIYTSQAKRIYNAFADTSSKKGWGWISKKLSMGYDSQLKKFKKVRLSGTQADIMYSSYPIGSEGIMSESHAVDGASDYVYTLDTTDADTLAKWIQYRLDGTDEVVNSIGTIFKRKSVK